MVMAPMLQMLRAKQLPVNDIHMPLQACGNCAFIQMTRNNKMEVREAMQTAMANPIAPRLAIIVDDDIDIYDVKDVLYAPKHRLEWARLRARREGRSSLPTSCRPPKAAAYSISGEPDFMWFGGRR